MIAIIDYGMGNLHSVKKALESFGGKVIITQQPKDILRFPKLVLPGVGAFDDAVTELKKRKLFSALKEQLNRGKVFLGICLGMQLLFSESQEAKSQTGLGVLAGKVRRFEPRLSGKVPHMGWNQLKKSSVECPLLRNIPDGANVYFCHSYYPQPKNKGVVAATTEYGIGFASVVWQENIYGVQFHPEKSQAVGLKILENFVKL